MNVSLALVHLPLRLSSCVQLPGSQMSLEIVGKGPSSVSILHSASGTQTQDRTFAPSSIASSWRQLCLSPVERILNFCISLLLY